MTDSSHSLGQCATLACLLEVSAPKPGNVHRGADFEDMGLNDFMVSAVAVGPVYEKSASMSVGAMVLSACRATKSVVSVNTNLGINLLFAPLAAAAKAGMTQDALSDVLRQLDADDANDVYEAIRLAQPGGLQASTGQSESDTLENDVHGAAPSSLLEAMQQAASWDRIAWQYANRFDDIFTRVVPWLLEDADRAALPDRIVATHVRMMSECPDSLIARKCGAEIASSRQLTQEPPLPPGSAPPNTMMPSPISTFGFEVMGIAETPVQTADLVAAGLFVALATGQLKPPFSNGSSE